MHLKVNLLKVIYTLQTALKKTEKPLKLIIMNSSKVSKMVAGQVHLRKSSG
jgi:hypothetical protein